MRIIQLGKYFPPDWGGIETVTHNLAVGFCRRGIGNTVLASTDSADDEARIEIPDATETTHVYRAANLFKLASAPVSWRYVAQFRRLMRDHDVVLAHMPNPLACATLLLSGYQGKVALFWHSDVIRQRLLLHAFQRLQDWTVRRADVIIGATRAHVEESDCTPLFSGRSTVISYPVDEELRELARTIVPPSSGLSHKQKVTVLAVGRLVYYKGFQYLIQAAAALPKRFHFVIAGTGPDRAMLERLIAQANLGTRVRLAGSLTRAALRDHYRACDLFCLPSVERAEMFGVVQQEAMAHGKPVVSCRIPRSGVPYVNRHEEVGLLVPPRDAQALANAIHHLAVDDALYMRVAHNGLQEIKMRYNLDTITAAHIETYTRL